MGPELVSQGLRRATEGVLPVVMRKKTAAHCGCNASAHAQSASHTAVYSLKPAHRGLLQCSPRSQPLPLVVGQLALDDGLFVKGSRRRGFKLQRQTRIEPQKQCSPIPAVHLPLAGRFGVLHVVPDTELTLVSVPATADDGV